MLLVKGVSKGRIGSVSSKKTTDKVHILNGQKTKCGINHEKSVNLGIPYNGSVEEVNCRRCFKKR